MKGGVYRILTENCSFYEEYQDRFNNIYDDIEERLLDNEL